MSITPITATQDRPQADSILKLDPILIALPKHPNRHESFFKSTEFFALKDAIGATRGNTVPVKVHRIPSNTDQPLEYEADYGVCRIRACRALGLAVLAIVSSAKGTEREQLLQRVQENSCRTDFCPVDLGRIYLDAYERKLVTTQAEFANQCGRDAALLSKAIKLASLPAIILDLFDQIQDVQYRYAKPLWDAFKGPQHARFLQFVHEAEQLPRPRNPEEIVAILTGKAKPLKTADEKAIEPFKLVSETVLRWQGKPTGRVVLMDDGQVDITMSRKLEPKSCQVLVEVLQTFLDSGGGKRSASKKCQSKGASAKIKISGVASSAANSPAQDSTQLDLNLSDPNDGDVAEVVEVQS